MTAAWRPLRIGGMSDRPCPECLSQNLSGHGDVKAWFRPAPVTRVVDGRNVTVAAVHDIPKAAVSLQMQPLLYMAERANLLRCLIEL